MRTLSPIYPVWSLIYNCDLSLRSQKKKKNTPRTHLANPASEGNILPNPCGQPDEALEHETLF